jgi:hypothetical protein
LSGRPSSPLDQDPYWQEVAQLLDQLVEPSGLILAPVEFLMPFPGAVHYHADYLFAPESFAAVVVHTGMLGAFDPEFLRSTVSRLSPVFANDVFVVFVPGLPPGRAPATGEDVDRLLQQVDGLPRPARGGGDRVAIVVKTFGRIWALERSLPQIAALGAPVLVVDDGSSVDDRQAKSRLAAEHGCSFLPLPGNRGGSCTLNVGVCYWLADPEIGWISVFEDDVDVQAGALAALGDVHDATDRPLLTGFYAPEHPVVSRIELGGRSVLLQRSARGTHLHAHRDYWRAVLPVPTPYLGAPKPGGGRPGQACDADWWVTAWSPQSITKRGGFVACLPGTVEHFANLASESTWSNPTLDH